MVSKAGMGSDPTREEIGRQVYPNVSQSAANASKRVWRWRDFKS